MGFAKQVIFGFFWAHVGRCFFGSGFAFTPYADPKQVTKTALFWGTVQMVQMGYTDKRRKGQTSERQTSERQTSERTNVRSDKRQKGQTSEATNVRNDKRQKGQTSERQTSEKRRKKTSEKRRKIII